MRRFIHLAIAAALLTATGSIAAPAYAEPDHWSTAWGAAAQSAVPTADWYGANWSVQGFADDSVRQAVRITGGGSKIRIRLSNVYGTKPLHIAGATVARADLGAAIRAGSLRTLRFGGRSATMIPPGREIVSDAAAFHVSASDRLAVTLRLATPTGPATFHHFAMATSYRAKTQPDGERVRQQVNHWIRTSGAYDAVVDFDRVVADGDQLEAGYDSGDHIHLNDTGYRAIADAIDLDTL